MLPVAALHVLVVEDDDTVRRLLTEELTARMPPVEVDSARDGIEALHKISTSPYRVVILDLMMPNMSGTDVLDSLSALASDPSVKSLDQPPAVLVITAASETAIPDEVIRKRCPQTVRGVFRKPLDVPALAASVETFLR
jgi:CheY-like chemotaxis protein